MSGRCEECRGYVFAKLDVRREAHAAKRFAAAHYGHGATVKSKVRRLASLHIAHRVHKNDAHPEVTA